mmetsp:Transcript_72395/g.125511  ORF Transcript_72395/g.125511 Transcript_72395/m.125511 type:complete len:455 (-) Transcript_72395:148-1512(-)
MGNQTQGLGLTESFHKKYILGKQLGKGSQGRVHMCVDRETREVRAVKVIDRNLRTAWATYKREVELCKSSESSSSSSMADNVIRVLEEFVDSNNCYVVMEKFEGHLRKGLKWVAQEAGSQAKVLGNSSLRRLTRQVCFAIRHLHNCGVVHRDVKAHNLLVDRLDLRDARCRVVLGDLGLARRLEPGRFLSAQVGTRKYWAPELYDKRYWHVVDVFAVGVTLFLAASCAYPFLDEQQTRTRDVFAEEAVSECLSPNARHFLHKALLKDPRFRPSSVELVEHPWFVEGELEEVCSQSRPDGCIGPKRPQCVLVMQVLGDQTPMAESDNECMRMNSSRSNLTEGLDEQTDVVAEDEEESSPRKSASYLGDDATTRAPTPRHIRQPRQPLHTALEDLEHEEDRAATPRTPNEDVPKESEGGVHCHATTNANRLQASYNMTQTATEAQTAEEELQLQDV